MGRDRRDGYRDKSLRSQNLLFPRKDTKKKKKIETSSLTIWTTARNEHGRGVTLLNGRDDQIRMA